MSARRVIPVVLALAFVVFAWTLILTAPMPDEACAANERCAEEVAAAVLAELDAA